MANKYANLSENEVKTTIQFTFHWKGNRKPEFVIFPNGRKARVDYMRNGQIAFDSGDFGSYKRILDNNKTQERSIIIEIEEE